MAKERPFARSGASANAPWDVRVIVTVEPRGGGGSCSVGTRTRFARRLAALALALALLSAVAYAVARRGLVHRSVRPAVAQRSTPALAGVAMAFGYPSRCLTVTVSAGAPTYAQAEVVRRPGCPPYRGYVDATFHRVDGRWRLVLDEGQLFVPNRLLARCRSAWPSCRPTGVLQAARTGPMT
jgi:hypothetical protein